MPLPFISSGPKTRDVRANRTLRLQARVVDDWAVSNFSKRGPALLLHCRCGDLDFLGRFHKDFDSHWNSLGSQWTVWRGPEGEEKLPREQPKLEKPMRKNPLPWSLRRLG